KSQAKEAEKLRESANVGKNHYETMLREHRFAMGFEKEPDRRDPAELEAAKNEEKLQPMLKDIEDARSILGYDAKYQANFKDLVAKLKKENDDLRGNLGTARKERADLDARLKAVDANAKKSWDAALQRIDDGNKEARKEAEKQLDQMKKASEDLRKLEEEKEKLIDQHRQDLEQFDLDKKKFQAVI